LFHLISCNFVDLLLLWQSMGSTAECKIILASRSPARFKLLKDEGFDVERDFPDVDEGRLPGEHVNDYAMRIALSKAKKVVLRHSEEKVVIVAVDTIIALGEDIYGKPETPERAREMLCRLSGEWHEVYSGTVVIDAKSGNIQKELVVTRVKFRTLTKEKICWYISTGEPLNAAGGYAIQSEGRKLIEEIDGCLTNVIGLSIATLQNLLNRMCHR